jgi:hypothetical protein
MILRKLLAAVCATLLAAPAIGMDNTSTPSKFPIPWGNNAGGAFIRSIPVNSQIGIVTGAASLADGFPPVTFTPIAAGGVPPAGQDFNGILRQVTQALRWAQAGGMYPFDSAFVSSIGGYPKGAVLQSKVLIGRLWMSVVDNNSTDPDGSITANWIPLPGTSAAGAPVPWFSANSAPPNTVLADGRSVGNASSNATGRANADTYWLFSFLWANCPACQLSNSAGTNIARGANSDADWNSNTRIATIAMQGAGLMGADRSTSFLSGVPVTSGNTGTPTSLVGENLHTQLVSEMALHYHTAGINDPGHTHAVQNIGFNLIYNATGAGGIGGGSSFGLPSTPSSLFAIAGAVTGVRVASSNGLDTTYSTGGNGPANIVQRNYLVYWYLAL